MINKQALKAMTILDDAGFESRVVGGAVRDYFLGINPKDWDIATTALPEQVIEVFADFQVIPTGLQHGTVTVVIDEDQIEITTLRIDEETDGRWAEVSFTTDWELDAERRDLTFNAMSMNKEGEIFDYFGGKQDLLDCCVRFVGDAETRIQEDYLRILRAFRFAARYTSKLDFETLTAIKENRQGLRQISGERIWSEFQKILATKEPYEILIGMFSTEIDREIGLDLGRSIQLGFPFLALTNDVPIRLAMLTTKTEHEKLFKSWKLDRETFDRGQWLFENKKLVLTETSVNQAIGLQIGTQNQVADLALFQGKKDLSDLVKNATFPEFPVRGQDLLNQGMKPGPDVGKALRDMREKWTMSNFELTKEELLND